MRPAGREEVWASLEPPHHCVADLYGQMVVLENHAVAPALCGFQLHALLQQACQRRQERHRDRQVSRSPCNEIAVRRGKALAVTGCLFHGGDGI